MLVIKDLHKSYDIGHNKLHVLKGINLEIGEGEFVSIMGSSGSGKSTLLNIIGILDEKDSGIYELDGIPIEHLTETKAAEYRNRMIGFVFQSHQLLPEFTALENVCIPAYIAKKSRKEAETRAKELLDFLGLSHRMEHKPGEMSGGEQQRVAIARANGRIFEESPGVQDGASVLPGVAVWDLRKPVGETQWDCPVVERAHCVAQDGEPAVASGRAKRVG